MITFDPSPPVMEWLARFLAEGASLSQAVLRRLPKVTRITAVVPVGWQPLHPSDLDEGGRRLNRELILRTVGAAIERHFGAYSRACVLVEDRWASKIFPCGVGALPWITMSARGGEELYWLSDDRQTPLDAEAILGSATGRRFLAVLSKWSTLGPEVCSTVSPATIEEVSANAVGFITEIFDGESYLIAELGV